MKNSSSTSESALVTTALWLKKASLHDDSQAVDAPMPHRMIILPVISFHEGCVVSENATDLVATFSNVVNAVNCAQELVATVTKTGEKLYVSMDIQPEQALTNEGWDRPKLFDHLPSGISGIYISQKVYNAYEHHQHSISELIPSNSEKEEMSMDEVFLYKLKSIIDFNISNEQFSVEDLAQEMALSRSQVHRKLSALTSNSISQFIRNIRLERARKLLTSEVGTASEISYRVGFSSPSYFSRCFHEYFGYSPGETKNRKVQIPEKLNAFEVYKEESSDLRLFKLQEKWTREISKRQLAALSLISWDENVTSAQSEFPLEWIQECAKSYGGVLVKILDHKLLCYYSYTKDAADAALKMLKGRDERYLQTNLSIALHIGDVEINSEGLIEGDGFDHVNQLIELAVPGSIAISQKAKDEITSHKAIETKFLGTYNFEKIDRPIGVYAILHRGLTVPDTSRIIGRLNPSTFQGLHSVSMQKHFKEIFEDMLQFKPALEKYILLDEDDEDDEVDIRILTYQIIKNFPWPIGIELRRLFSGTYRQNNQDRLIQIFRTLESVLQFVVLCMLGELHELLNANGGKMHAEDANGIKRRLALFEEADVLWLFGKLANYLKDHQEFLVIKELASIDYEKHIEGFDQWVMDRVEIQSGRNWSEATINEKCLEYEVFLAEILKSFAFLVGLKMVNVSSIEVMKRKHTAPVFKHHLDILNSTDAEFRTRQELTDQFSESNAVLLKRTLKDTDNYLNLSPFIVDTHKTTLSIADHRTIKKDIYIYKGFNGSHLMFRGTEVSEDSDLSSIENYDLLVEEFRKFLGLLSGSINERAAI